MDKKELRTQIRAKKRAMTPAHLPPQPFLNLSDSRRFYKALPSRSH